MGSRDFYTNETDAMLRNEYDEAGLVTVEEAREIAARYNASHWRDKSGVGECARYTIPADPKRDDDIRLEAFIARAEKAFAELEKLERIRSNELMALYIPCLRIGRDRCAGECRDMISELIELLEARS